MFLLENRFHVLRSSEIFAECKNLGETKSLVLFGEVKDRFGFGGRSQDLRSYGWFFGLTFGGDEGFSVRVFRFNTPPV